SLHKSILSQTFSLRKQCASGHLPRLRSLAAQVAEAPLPPGPPLVLSGEQCVHLEIRAHHGALTFHFYSLVGRLPSRKLAFSPSNLRSSGNLRLSPWRRTQDRFPAEGK